MSEWDALTALQRDLLIAEKVFEIKTKTPSATLEPYSVIRHYTADILAAWSLVETVGVRSETEVYRPFLLHRSENGVYYAEFNLADSSGYGFAQTAPEAICKAALRAVGVMV